MTTDCVYSEPLEYQEITTREESPSVGPSANVMPYCQNEEYAMGMACSTYRNEIHTKFW
jgi:hypothetical protein